MANILWLIFSFMLVLFSVMSLVLIYHWRAYGTNLRTITLMQALYLTVGLLLIAVSGLSILFI